MKRLLALMLSVCMMAAALSGCGKKEEPLEAPDSQTEDQGEEPAEKPAAEGEANGELPKVVCLLNGNLGDKSFFDSANAGMKLIKDELGCETNVIEMGFDNTVWETTLYEVSDQDWDIIIVGTFQMQEVLEKVALEYPDKKYIMCLMIMQTTVMFILFLSNRMRLLIWRELWRL